MACGFPQHLRRVLDHAAIFLLIAGTNTPLMLVNLRGPWGWSLLVVIWGLAVAGTVLRLFLRGRLHGVVVATYVIPWSLPAPV
ncbi:MAG: hemolysin III family protein [Rhodocyclaceae bacterium]